MQEQNEKQIDQVDIFENDIELYIQLFCEKYNIEDMTKESQARWNACLQFIRKNVFNDKSMLKDNNIINNTNINNNIMPSTYNRYNYSLLNNIVDIYIYYCSIYDKEVSINGFSFLTGINTDSINNWSYDEKSSSESFAIYKKLSAGNEESLSAKLATGNKNPVGIIAILNRRHGWASPYTSDSNRQKTVLTAAELPRLEQISNTDSLKALPIVKSS